jgi:hypothetical protein
MASRFAPRDISRGGVIHETTLQAARNVHRSTSEKRSCLRNVIRAVPSNIVTIDRQIRSLVSSNLYQRRNALIRR